MNTNKIILNQIDSDSEDDIKLPIRIEISDKNNPYNFKFNNKWSLWYHKIKDNWKVDGFEKFFEINNIGDFWDFHNNIHHLTKKENSFGNLNIFMMRENILPTWESDDNRNGGCWSLKVNNKDSFNIWVYLASYVVGETFMPQNIYNINGISYCWKNANSSVIKIWNRDSSNIDIKLLNSEIVKLYGYNMIYMANLIEY